MLRIYKQAFLATLLGGLFTTGAAVAQPTTGGDRSGNFWGESVGSFAITHCAPGSVAIGITGGAGELVDSMRLICAPVISPGVLGGEYFAGGGGGDGGTPYQLRCAWGYAIEGIYGKAGVGLDRIGIRCRTLDWRYGYTAGYAGGYGGGDFWDHVSPGEFLTGFNARVAPWNGNMVIRGITVRYSTIYW
ncbi:hypothetical protein ATI61_107325 [Archangium gephyra]|uniref:Flagellar hook-length control protein FliK n=1 Tax=Archangium gephyra TaxID=48 RepID=A0AAC8QIV6_9BACT|nr:hypothetical protein [Archangium gephyra]AKJ07881.1 Hypothetical protein AA314_09507 [Archangium gephyra]REG29629.1 hypothetical protein ATI61_107325 [Archangium gephyra]